MSEDPKYAVIDVETTRIKENEIPKTLFWGYADERGYERFATTKKLATFLKHEERRTLLHHANFDVIQMLVDGETIQPLRSHNGRLIRCQYGHHQTINTLSCFPVSLEKIFKAFGHEKTDLEQLDKRNYDDCVLGLKCFLELDEIFVDLCGVSPLKRGTIASTSFHAAEKFLKKKMPVDDRFLESYRGGRVEVYDLRCYAEDTETEKHFRSLGYDYEWIHQNASLYDINSSYPMSFLDAPREAELWKVRVDTKDYHCPLFDAGFDDMLLFPNGVFFSYVYHDVFEKYIEPYMEHTAIKILSRHKIDFHWLHSLKPFVQTLYDKKNSSTGGIKEVCKFLLNSMYGRMGLRGESERARILDYRPDGEETIVYPLGRNRWLVFSSVECDAKSNFPFASYITDNGRGRLYKAIKQNNSIYSDTDSIFCRDKTFVGQVSNTCGEYSFKGRKPFQAINVKDYFFGGEEVRKGGSEHLIWSLKQFAKTKVGNANGATRVLRERNTELRKRIVMPNGETIPHTNKTKTKLKD
jgi:hypothetical protein